MLEHANPLFRNHDFSGCTYPRVGKFSAEEVRAYCGGKLCPTWLGCPPAILERVMSRNVEKRTRNCAVEARERARRIAADIERDERNNPPVLTDAQLIAKSKRIASEIQRDELKDAERERSEKLQKWQRGLTQPWQ